MTMKTSAHRQKQTAPRPDSSNCNSIYGLFEIGLVGFIWVQPMPQLLLATVNSNHIGS